MLNYTTCIHLSYNNFNKAIQLPFICSLHSRIIVKVVFFYIPNFWDKIIAQMFIENDTKTKKINQVLNVSLKFVSQESSIYTEI